MISYAKVTELYRPEQQKVVNLKREKHVTGESIPLVPEKKLLWTIDEHIYSMLMKRKDYRELFRKLKISPFDDKFQNICEYHGEDDYSARFPMNEFSKSVNPLELREYELEHARYAYRELNKIASNIVSHILETYKTPEIFVETMKYFYELDS